MARGRVQINDLAPPERIQPAPIQSDTFARPAQAPIDNSLEQLSSALGFFNKNLMAKVQNDDAERKKWAQEDALARYSAYVSATEKTKVYEDFTTGRSSFLSDPFTAKVAKADYARMSAEELARGLDEGNLAWGSGEFNPEKEILGRARGYVEKFSVDKDLMVPFQRHLDQIRESADKRHIARRGEIQKDYIEDKSRRTFADLLEAGVRDRLPPEQLLAAIRKEYKALGPREEGGVFGVPYKKQDEYLLDTLDAMSDRPEVAILIPGLLAAEREDLKNAGVKVGSLRFANEKRALAIFEKSQKTLAKATGEQVSKRVMIDDVTALEALDGSAATRFGQDHREPNPFDPDGKDIVVSKGEREKAAVEAFMQRTMGDTNKQLDVLSKHVIKHPQLFDQIEQGFMGFGGTNIQAGNIGLQQIEAIEKTAQIYRLVADKNYGYAKKFLSKEAGQFFESYDALTRYGGYTPERAAQAMALAASREQAGGGEIEGGLRSTFDKAAASLDTAPWWPGGKPTNEFEARTKIRDLAYALVRGGGAKPEDALKMATAAIQERMVSVNGRALIGVPGIEKDDAATFTDILNSTYKKHKAALASEGITSASQLSVSPLPNGSFRIVDNASGMPISLFQYEEKFGEKRVTGTIAPLIKLEDIQLLRITKITDSLISNWKRQMGIKTPEADMVPNDKSPAPLPNPLSNYDDNGNFKPNKR